MIEQTWLLPSLIAIPLIAGFLCWLFEKKDARLPRWVALIGMTLTFVLSLVLYAKGDFGVLNASTDGSLPWVATFEVPWIPAFGIKFSLAMDGLSLLMIVLTAFLGIMAVGCSWGEIKHRVGFFHLNLLWSLGGVIGVFLAIDLFLFFFFWEMMLLPIYFLIALWGHDVRDKDGNIIKPKSAAATKFFIYTQASGLIMFIGISMLVLINFAQKGVLSFHYEDLLGTYLGKYEYLIMLCFFVGFAVKLPVFPLHGWLPDVHAQAPTAGSVDLAGILIKTAAFGLLRFVIPLFPNASAEFTPIAITLGMIGVFYGAFLAFAQTDIKRLLAYTSVSHMGFVVLAIYAGTLVSLQGLMVQMLAHGLSSAALFIVAGQVYERLHTRDMTVMGGMWGQFRYLAPFMMFFCAALLGIPGTGNFIGEILILMGSFKAHPVISVLLTVSFVWAGLYALILIHKALFGDNTTPYLHALYKGKDDTAKPLRDLGGRELSLLGVLAVGLVWLGLYPQPVLHKSEQAMSYISTKMPDRYSDVDTAITGLKGNQKPISPEIVPQVIEINQGGN
ncbi:NADH-quinone oxidoreductase subunit M [Moraxella bovis]|uniref:NADH-quinone oxidoreductase subunit M n=1 Tax=Moraxella bovis TaxID=476 RepID=A0AAQ2Q2L6_MORBO|nr:NADH-quinone oxidoreductase subunit M [Moraxella bovis]AWY20669.1 NADH-quinone oxidoreductase subunit M [Moraxella bovis]UYZ76653.1 NADH-quinone oxidoreductase subunit M [Moraxella bovis]UYZ77394.1 NADH-quinone oxidoreductase subunit M [Moraxella bovis]UYZ82126.1 NADH-quinone oxidoreductase subunit M [Moraxella bovis]UYZ85879.1 NADH-quinone oxidoreductase subunit M [Moraxella bovis]